MWNSMFFFSSCVVLSIFTKETIWMVLYWICLIFLFCLKAYRIDKWPKIKRCDRIDGRHVEHSAIAGFFLFAILLYDRCEHWTMMSRNYQLPLTFVNFILHFEMLAADSTTSFFPYIGFYTLVYFYSLHRLFSYMSMHLLHIIIIKSLSIKCWRS